MKGFVSMAGQATWAGELRPESVPILARAGAVCIIRSPSLDQAFDAEKQAMIKDVIAAAQEAGRLIERCQSAGVSADRKADASPVTEADRQADELLKQKLLQLLPVGLLSEETADDPSRLEQDQLWVVDPLDGTKEFIRGIPEYSVAIALVEKGDPVLGVVHNPAAGDTYWAERGRGAFCNGHRVRVREGSRVVASRSETKRGEFDVFGEDWDIQPVGSIQLKLGLVAAGEAAVTLSRGPKHEWDVCAGSLLVAEAGGLATDVFGEPLRYNQPFPKTKGILAGAPMAYSRARELVVAVGASDRMREFDDLDARNVG